MATEIQNKLAAMTAAFLARLTDKVGELAEAASPLDDIASSGADAISIALTTVQGLAHKLAGSAGTYGFGNIGHTARNLELLCQALLEQTDTITEQELSPFRDLLALMAKQAENAASSGMTQPNRIVSIPDVLVEQESSREIRKLVLVDDDTEQSQFLEQLLTNFGFSVRVLDHPSALESVVQQDQPDAVIMDIMFPDDRDAGLTTVNRLRDDKTLQCPVIFISGREDFPARLKAIRGGADGYVVKPVNINDLVATLNRLIAESDRPPFRVLIVDDDEEMTDFCQVVLEGAGLQASVVNDPMIATEEMLRFGPDVILLDIEMPGCNGFELAATIRQMGDRHLQTPILYLTAHNEVSNQMQAARSGSEDFIAKPVDPERLITSVLARSERSRILRGLFERLRAGEERFGSITRSANEAILSANSLGLVLSWNPSAQRIFGYKAREILGKPLTVLIPERYRQSHEEGFKRVCDGGKPKIVGKTVQLFGLRKDGTEFPLDLSLSSWESGGELFFAATMRDITERKETEAALKHAKDEADLANKAKSEFLSSMSHELRTPLNAILGFGQLLQFNPKEPLTESQGSSVDLILKGGNHLLELINDILDLARIEAGKVNFSIESIEVSAVIGECLSLVSSMAERKGVSVEIVKTEAGSGLFETDFTRIKQVMLNLLSNAIKYNRDDGKVTIRIDDTGTGFQRISVIDTGFGIPPESQGDLFKPFNRLGAEKTGIEGTGIGLVVCKQLVESMHGKIGMESKDGAGSTFWFEMPSSAIQQNRLEDALADETETATAPPESASPKEGMGLMLYVEDNPSNLHLMEMIVSRVDDLTLISAHTAELGIELSRSRRPDIIILDINLPGMDGYQALKKLKEYEETKDIPVLALSAAATRRDVEKGAAAGFARYMTKPMQVKEVIAAINEHIKR